MAFNPEQKKEICDKWLAGTTRSQLAEEYGSSEGAIKNVTRTVRRTKDFTTVGQVAAKNIAEFTSRVRSVLWRQDFTKEKPTYEKWQARVKELQAQDGGAYTEPQAIVRASKEFVCLHKLFREYDLSVYDPNPESHSEIQYYGKVSDAKDVLIENTKQSFRENLDWAINAAGAYCRLNQMPPTCPNDAAWFLFLQARDNPKEFLARIGQIEAKDSGDTAEKRGIRSAAHRSIEEIDSYLAELEQDNEEKHEETS